MATLRPILADQLTLSLASLRDIDPDNDAILIAEVRQEATYVKHNKKKIILLFSAMRHFARQLESQGYRVHYVAYDDAHNKGSLTAEVVSACERFGLDSVAATFPGEYRVWQDMLGWQDACQKPVQILEDDRFLASIEDFRHWADGRTQLRMEYFYREMRKRWRFLMDGDQPAGGKWNYDSANRKPIPKNIDIPEPTGFAPDSITQSVIALVDKHFADHCGKTEDFHFAVTREQALNVLEQFVHERLVNFGDYQDAMVFDKPWLFHSHISFYLNCGLLTPDEVIQSAEQQYYQGKAPLNAVEGFIRQVLGWREYVRGLYWYKMPGYQDENYLQANHPLPDMFWTADTKMTCMQQCLQQTLDNAYAHHIQRLMVIGNFSLLAGLSPEQVNEWYLAVYADAYEWVEMPNVTGMILFADGGVLASKPYAASGAYIHKMSDYCQHCHYSVKEKSGEMACPFNYLYWHFLKRHQSVLGRNPRLAMPYRTMSKFSEQKLEQIDRDSLIFLTRLSEGENL